MMRAILFLICLTLGSAAKAGEYRSIDNVLNPAFEWSQASLEFSRYRWEQEKQGVIAGLPGEFIDLEIEVYAPDIEVVDDAAILSAEIEGSTIQGRSFSSYEQSCRFERIDITVKDHLKSTALTLTGRSTIAAQGSIESVEFGANCTTRLSVVLHTWKEVSTRLASRKPAIEVLPTAPQLISRALPPTEEAIDAARPIPETRHAAEVPTIDTRPAMFADDAFENAIVFPDSLRGDMQVVVKCDARVNKRGAIRRLSCWGDREDTFVRATQDAFEVARFSPATVNDKPASVDLPISVLFSRSGGVERVTAFENHEARPGYTGPQRYKTGTTSTCGTAALWQTLEVDAFGMVRSVDIKHSSASDKCISRIAQKRKDDRYIPAIANGEPVDARIVAVFEY